MHRGVTGASTGPEGGLRMNIGVLSFKRSSLGAIYMLQADPLIEITDLVLEHADPDFLSRSDRGTVTFHCANGTVSYRLKDYDALQETWIAQRTDVSDEDLAED